MPYFDGADLGEPQAQSALGYLSSMAGSFADSAMPSALPVPMGAVLGHAAQAGRQGQMSGAQQAQTFRKGQLEISSAAVGLDQALIVENMLRKALGKPELTAADLQGANGSGPSSPLFGRAMVQPSSTAAPAVGGGTATGAPADGSSPSTTQDGVGNALVMKLLGFAPSDHAKASMEAGLLPEGSAARNEADAFAEKTAGLNPSLDTRSGGMQSVLVPGKFNPDGTPVYKTIIKNPTIPEGYGAGPPDENGNPTIVPLKGGPEAVSDIEARKGLGHAEGTKNVNAFDNWLDTGGLGLGTSSGTVRQPGSGPVPAQPASTTVPPGYAQRVAQLESSGNPNAQNPQAGQTSAGLDGFNNATWLEQAKKYIPAEALQGKTDAQILALRSDPRVSTALTNAFAQDNASQMGKAGIKNVGPTELYLAHHFGADGAAAILKAPVNAPLGSILPAKVLQANPDLQGATVADVYAHANQSMKGVQAPTDQPIKSAQGTVIPSIKDAAPINSGAEYLKERIPEWAKTENEWNDALPSGQIAEQRALAISDALKQVQSGAYTTDLAGFAAKLKTLGINIPIDKMQRDPAAVEEAIKNNFQSTLQQIRAFSSRPAAIEVQLASKNFANPDLQPAANQQIIAETVGTIRWDRAMINDWAEAKKQGWQDPEDFQRVWMKQNPLQGFIDQTQKEIGPLKGMPGTKVDPEKQKLITPGAITAAAKARGMSEDQVKADLKAHGYSVP